MRKFVWALAIVAALLWSLTVWGGYALVGWANDAIAGAPGAFGLPPEVAYWVAWAGYLFEQAGQGAAMVVWVLGLAVLALLAFLVSLLFGSGRRAAERFSEPRQVEQSPFRPAPRAAPPEAPRPMPVEPTATPTTSWGRNADRR